MTGTAQTVHTAAADESTQHMEALGWAFTHPPTQEAYRRSTGEDAAPVLERYRRWIEENLIGIEQR